MAVHHLQEIARRPVERDRVGDGTQPAEGVAAFGIGAELPAQVVVGLVGILLLVEPVGRGLPHRDHRTRDRPAVLVEHPALHQRRLAVPVLGVVENPAALLEHGRVLAPEGPEHRGIGRRVVLAAFMVEEIDQALEPEDVADQDRLVALVVGHLADADHEVAGREILRRGQLHLAGEVVQVPDQGGHHLARARGGLGTDRLDDGVGEGTQGNLSHFRLLGSGADCGKTGRREGLSRGRRPPRAASRP